jgi:hypothetical protein
MMSQSKERSMSLYPFTPSGYPTKIHYVLCGSSAFLFLEGILAHAREPKYMEVGHFRFEATPSLVGGLILDISMGRYFLDVGCTIKCFIP